MGNLYQPWTFADLETVRAKRREQFAKRAGESRVALAQNRPAVSPLDLLDRYSNPGNQPKPVPVESPAAPKKGGGGFLGKLRDVAGDVAEGTMKALDAPRQYGFLPVQGAIAGAIEGDLPDSYSEARARGKAVDKSISEKFLNIKGVPVGGFVYQAATDPLNLVGAGAVTKVAKAKGLTKLARFNELAGVAQNKVGREVLGGLAGTMANQAAGGEQKTGLEWWEAGALGALAGTTTRAFKGRTMPGMAAISADNPFMDDYLETLDRMGIAYSYADDGTPVIDDLARADEIVGNSAETASELVSERPKVGPWQGSDSPANRYGTAERAEKEYRNRGKNKGKAKAAFIENQRERVSSADPKLHDEVNDAERLMDLLDDEVVDPKREALRKHFEAERDPLDFQPLSEDAAKAAQDVLSEPGGFTRRKREAAASLGIDEADRIAREFLTPEWSPIAASRELANKAEEISWSNDFKPTATQKATIRRLQEISVALKEEGTNYGTPRSGVVPEGRASAGAGRPVGAVEEVAGAPGAAPGPSTTGETVKTRDIYGNVVDTFKTESEHNGVNASQGSLLDDSGAAAKRAAWGDAAGGETGIVPADVPAASADETVPPPEPDTPDFAAGAGEGPVPPLDTSTSHATLGLDPSKTYTAEELKAAYRKQARRYHPDVNPSETADADMKAINRAFEDLSGRTGATQRASSGAKKSGPTYSDYQRARDEAKRWREEWERMERAKYERWKAEAPDRERKAHEAAREDPFMQQGAGIPPGEPPKEPPPVKGKGKQGAMGEKGPLADLLNAPTREATLARGEVRADAIFGWQKADSWKTRVSDSVKRAFNRMNEEIEQARSKVDPFLREKKRQDIRREALVEWFIQRERAVLKTAGLEIRNVDGSWRMFAGDADLGIADDIIERTTDAGRKAFSGLAPEQQAAIAQIGETNRLFNETKQFHGADVRIDPEIEGDYFGRRVASRTYAAEGGEKTINRATAGVPSRKVGAQRTKSRVIESVEELERRGYKIDDPWTTRAAVLRGKLLDAQDAYLVKNLKPLRVKKPGSTLGLMQVTGHPGFNNQWFTPEVAERIQKGLEPRKGAIPAAAAVNSVLTPLRASFDLSATFQQGLRFWLTNPKQGAEYWWTVMRSLRDESVYQNLMLKFDEQARAMGFADGLTDFIKNDLRYSGGLTGSEFTMPEWLPNKIREKGSLPGRAVAAGFEASNQHFDRLLNSYRLHTALAQAKRLQMSGLEGDDLMDALRESNRAVNRMFGWTDTEPTSLEQAVVFAPRYTRASVETLMNALKKPGIESNLARQHMALMLAEGAGAVWLFNTLRGYETEFDPRDSNFLRFRNVAGRDITPFGTYNTLFKALAGAIGGDKDGGMPLDPLNAGSSLYRFMEGKLSPAVATAYWPIKGETYLGEPISMSSWGEAGRTAKIMAPTFLPFGVQGAMEDGALGSAVSSFGLSNTPVTATEKRDFRRDDVAKERFGKPYSQLTGAERSQVNEDEKVFGYQQEADERVLGRGGEAKRARQAQITAREEIAGAAKYLEAGKDDQGNPYSGTDFRAAYHDIVQRRLGAYSVLPSFRQDADVAAYFKTYDDNKRADGTLDFDGVERDQDALLAKNPGLQTKIDRLIGANDHPAVRELREARKEAQQYYDIPAYLGMSVEDARMAQSLISEANAMVGYGLAVNRQHALALLSQQNPRAFALDAIAKAVGANPARKQFRTSHPLFAKYYSGVAGFEDY